jgi:hypothetical protein
METVVLAMVAAAAGGMGGFVAHALRTRFARPTGTPEDHEERIAALESVTRTVAKAQKAARMRDLREQRQQLEQLDLGPAAAPAGSAPSTRAALKAQIRASLNGHGRG